MNRYLAHALGLWIVVLPPGALAQDSADPTAVAVTCVVQGHDLILYNRTTEPLPPGTEIRWSAWNGRREGNHTLTEPLEPDIGLPLSSALGGSYLWDRPCEAYLAPAQDEDERNGSIHLQGGKGNAPVVDP
jgi:hypothetical protein